MFNILFDFIILLSIHLCCIAITRAVNIIWVLFNFTLINLIAFICLLRYVNDPIAAIYLMVVIGGITGAVFVSSVLMLPMQLNVKINSSIQPNKFQSVLQYLVFFNFILICCIGSEWDYVFVSIDSETLHPASNFDSNVLQVFMECMLIKHPLETIFSKFCLVVAFTCISFNLKYTKRIKFYNHKLPVKMPKFV